MRMRMRNNSNAHWPDIYKYSTDRANYLRRVILALGPIDLALASGICESPLIVIFEFEFRLVLPRSKPAGTAGSACRRINEANSARVGAAPVLPRLVEATRADHRGDDVGCNGSAATVRGRSKAPTVGAFPEYARRLVNIPRDDIACGAIMCVGCITEIEETDSAVGPLTTRRVDNV